jgi:hypothetical protein
MKVPPIHFPNQQKRIGMHSAKPHHIPKPKPSRKSHTSRNFPPPEDSLRLPPQPTRNQVFREDRLLEQSPGMGVGRITPDLGFASDDELSEDEHTQDAVQTK